MALSYPPCLNVNTWIVVGCGGGLVTPLEELALLLSCLRVNTWIVVGCCGGLVTPLEELALLLSWFGTAVEVPPLVRTLLHGN